MKLILLLAGFVVIVLLIGAFLTPNDLAGCPDAPTGEGHCAPADAVIAVSGGDTAARAEQAIELYQRGWAPEIVFSGAAQDETGPSNAAAMRQIALQSGVPAEDILIEESGRTTYQNAVETSTLLNGSVASVIVVTSAYHQRRASLEFERAFDPVSVRNSPVLQDRQWSPWWWSTPRGWYLTMGELMKIAVYYIDGARA